MKSFFLLIGSLVIPAVACGQTVIMQNGQPVMIQNGQAVPVSTAGGFQAAPGSMPQPPNAAKPQAKKPDDKKDEAKKDDKKKKTDGKDAGEKKNPENVSRPKEPLKSKSAREGLVRKPNNKISFSFVGARWPDIMDVIADYSGMSLDWQQLPGDYLNFTTVREYTIEEARDEINRFLLARGYTMVIHAESLRVVKIDKLNKAMIPRVTAEELDGRMPHEFVKVSFQLDWLVAEEAVKEFKPMLSPNGKMFPLTTTNRLEAIDTVLNLREVRDVIRTEQSAQGQEKLVRVFTFKHRRAKDAIVLLRQLFDLPTPPTGKATGSISSSQLRIMQQMMQQLQKSKSANPGRDTKITLVLNSKDNSILVKAPVDKMAEIEKAYEEIDSPQNGANSLIQNIGRMNTYRLEAFDAQALVDMLNEIGELSPNTHLTIDEEKNTIIAYATIADHFTIKSLVDKLDGTYRRFRVIPLRRLQAEYVAGTIEFLLGEAKEEDNSRSSRYYYGYNQPQKKKERKFAVDADLENNRLLLFANEQEIKQIEDLLMKLGEVPSPDSPEARRRMISIDPELDANELLQRLQKMWPGKNPLNVVPVPAKPKPPQEPASDAVQPAEEAKPVPVGPPEITASSPVPSAPKPRVVDEVIVPRQSAEVQFRKRNQVGNPPYASSTIAARTETVRTGIATDDQPQEDTGVPFEVAYMATKSPTTQAAADEPPAPATAVDQTSEPQESTPGANDSTASEPAAATSDTPNTTFDPPANQPPPVINPKYQTPAPNQAPPAAAPLQPQPSVNQLPGNGVSGFEAIRRAMPNQNNSPITITITPEGQLLFACDDPDALLEFEEFVKPFSRAKPKYKLFHMKYASPGWVSLTLEEFFEKQEEKKQILDWYGDIVDTGDKGPNRLSKKRMPKFIPDTYTSTILVQNADPKQLATIEELIKIYDVAEPNDSRSVRVTEMFTIKYSRASVIATAIKEVYRDLLSANDKDLADQKDKNNSAGGLGTVTYIRGNNSDDKEEEAPVKFKGLLSLGVDDTSNTLVVSTTAGLLENIRKIIEFLDKGAAPASRMRVVPVTGNLNSAQMQQYLQKILNSQQGSQQQKKQKPQQPQQQGQQVAKPQG